jgi:hypothetical protein
MTKAQAVTVNLDGNVFTARPALGCGPSTLRVTDASGRKLGVVMLSRDGLALVLDARDKAIGEADGLRGAVSLLTGIARW